MSAGSINASNESPDNSASSTRVSSPGSYVPFPDPHLFSQPIAIPANQNNSTAGVPRQLSAGSTPYPRAPNVPIELNIPLGRLSPQSVRNAIATTNLDPPVLRAIIDALVETSNSRLQSVTQLEAARLPKRISHLAAPVQAYQRPSVRNLEERTRTSILGR